MTIILKLLLYSTWLVHVGFVLIWFGAILPRLSWIWYDHSLVPSSPHPLIPHPDQPSHRDLTIMYLVLFTFLLFLFPFFFFLFPFSRSPSFLFCHIIQRHAMTSSSSNDSQPPSSPTSPPPPLSLASQVFNSPHLRHDLMNFMNPHQAHKLPSLRLRTINAGTCSG